ncbi:hypothetical protein Ljam_1923 [Legionella jamestowniensis]|uniref:Uncharacterized protein n=1 Tax=Legionella jamestowniensis TaxID=455 RepID=A0A0W0UIM5_9GAMM|nr:hypothetical protein Ljam_1923 [Legionella jamestowniensis]
MIIEKVTQDSFENQLQTRIPQPDNPSCSQKLLEGCSLIRRKRRPSYKESFHRRCFCSFVSLIFKRHPPSLSSFSSITASIS